MPPSWAGSPAPGADGVSQLPEPPTCALSAGAALPADLAKARGFPGQKIGGHDAEERRPNAAIPSPIQLSARSPARAATPRLREGHVATYIPELAQADPTGSASASPPPTATSTRSATRASRSRSSRSRSRSSTASRSRTGARPRCARIGVEPTGDAFNSISLEPGTGRPLNPMINAGAIATTSLVAGHSPRGPAGTRCCGAFSLYAGRALDLDEAVYRSERATGHRNRAIGHMLRNFGILDERPGAGARPLLPAVLDRGAPAATSSLMAATLANGGVNPVTGERAVRGELVDARS